MFLKLKKIYEKSPFLTTFIVSLLFFNSTIYAYKYIEKKQINKQTYELYVIENKKVEEIFLMFSKKYYKEYVEYTSIDKNKKIIEDMILELKYYESALELCQLDLKYTPQCENEFKETKEIFRELIQEIKSMNTFMIKNDIDIIKFYNHNVIVSSNDIPIKEIL